MSTEHHKPRTINRLKELEALPEGTVIKDTEGALERMGNYWYWGDKTVDPVFPAIVLWEPEA